MDRAADLERQVPPPADWRERLKPEFRDSLRRISTMWDFLMRVERGTPHPPGSADDVRHWLLGVVREPPYSLPPGTRLPKGYVAAPSEEETNLRADEAGRFEAYLVGRSAADLAAVEPLPFRKTLVPRDEDQIRDRVAERWNLEPEAWYPSAEERPSGELLYLRRSFCGRADVLARLRQALERQAVARV